MSRVSQGLAASARWWRSRFSRNWRAATPAVVSGFDTTIGDDDLFEACRRLGVEPVGPVRRGYTRRSLGAPATAPDGSRSWVKLSALRGIDSHPQRDAELSAADIRGVSKPALLASRLWSEGGRNWLALQMTLAPSPTVETENFAGAGGARVGAPWIASLKQALDTLGRIETHQTCVSADRISALIKDCFGRGAEHQVDEWRCAHGDLHWTNITYPDLMLIDWENWGLAPRGYDAAHLIAFACAQPELVQRLEAAFAADLNTRSGRVAQLAVLARLLHEVDLGFIDPAYRRHLKAMAWRVLARR